MNRGGYHDLISVTLGAFARSCANGGRGGNCGAPLGTL